MKPLGIVTGPKTGTYIAVGRDIARVGKEAGVPIDVKPSGGSVDNIKRINSRENAALGIVQSDVLGFLARSENSATRRMGDELRLILPLYKEEVHLLARNDIASFAGLKDKRVVVGEDGSGPMLTAVNLLGMMDVTPAAMIKKNAAEGIAMVLSGEADAVLFVGGKPIKLFENLASLKQESPPYQALLKAVHFLPLNDPRMLQEYSTAELTPRDYDFMPAPIPTIAVTALLIDHDFTDASRFDRQRCAQIHTLTQALRRNLSVLQKTGHPKWKETSFDHPAMKWQKDPCAWEGAKEEKKPKKEKHRAKYRGPKPPLR